LSRVVGSLHVTVFCPHTETGDKKSPALRPAEQRDLWIGHASGKLKGDGEMKSAGDGIAISGETELIIEALDGAEFLHFDMA